MNACSTDRLSTLTDDPYLEPYLDRIRARQDRTEAMEKRLTGGKISLSDFSSGHEYFGLHRREDGWFFAEWAPNAQRVVLVGTFSDWQENDDYALQRVGTAGHWEIRLPADALHHGDLFRLRLHWSGGGGDRIPAYARRVVQDEHTHIFSAQVWSPPDPYAWQNEAPVRDDSWAPLIYEAHVGMAQEKEGVGTYDEFRRNTLPRIADAGYNTLQIMALMEHPYYGSFGYHVSSFFAASSRFGSPGELKSLVDAAHGAGLSVIMDIVHSHAVNNEAEGLSCFDGTLHQYFHDGARGRHPAWDSRCFDYGKPEVLHFFLSNCRFWLDEYRLDGFRFDGVTSMLYLDHGLGWTCNSYDDYFGSAVDEDAVVYLALANKLIHEVRPGAITIAEDVSGMPGLAAPAVSGGIGFDYRLAMGIPDFWFRMLRDVRDEHWDMGHLWHELTNRRADERTVGYVESHDQALVGGKTVMFELVDAAMYEFMRMSDTHLKVDRGIALHKMLRLVTLATAGDGYMNFMGNEFGHPEWIDFPREGNNWSYHYARRLWSLRDDPELKYSGLADFDRAVLRLFRDRTVIGRAQPGRCLVHNDDKIVVVDRAEFLFCFNFHPSESVPNYGVEVVPGEYRSVLDSDEARFGGQGRIAPDQRYVTEEDTWEGRTRHRIHLYLPARTALVLERVD